MEIIIVQMASVSYMGSVLHALTAGIERLAETIVGAFGGGSDAGGWGCISDEKMASIGPGSLTDQERSGGAPLSDGSQLSVLPRVSSAPHPEPEGEPVDAHHPFRSCLDRPYVQKEVRWAQKYRKKIIVVFEKESHRPGFFDYAQATDKYSGTSAQLATFSMQHSVD